MTLGEQISYRLAQIKLLVSAGREDALPTDFIITIPDIYLKLNPPKQPKGGAFDTFVKEIQPYYRKAGEERCLYECNSLIRFVRLTKIERDFAKAAEVMSKTTFAVGISMKEFAAAMETINGNLSMQHISENLKTTISKLSS